MAKPEQPSNGDQPEIKFAAAEATSVDYTKGGTVVNFAVSGNDSGAKDFLSDLIESAGGNVLDSSRKTSGKSHAMPGEKAWRVSWQPKGPQKPNQN